MTKFAATFDSSERVLSDGRILVPGEPVDLSPEDRKNPHNKRLIESGQIMEYTPPKKGDSS